MSPFPGTQPWMLQFISTSLPNKCKCEHSNTRVHVYKIADIDESMDEQPLVISHKIVILSDCTWSLCVHGHQVDSSICSNLATVPSVLEPGSCLAFLKLVDGSNVCVGQPDSRFVELLQQKSNKLCHLMAVGVPILMILPVFITMISVIK